MWEGREVLGKEKVIMDDKLDYPLCSDCRHSLINVWCNRLKKPTLVDGKPPLFGKTLRCLDERTRDTGILTRIFSYNKHKCGEEGRFWVKR